RDEVAVPGGELVERLEHLLALGPELRPLQPLLTLPRREIDVLELDLDAVAHLPRLGACELEHARGGRRGVESLVRIGRASEPEDRGPLRRTLGIEQPLGAVEAAAGDACE